MNGLPKVKGFQNFKNVITSIIISQCLIKLLEVGIVDVFEDKGRCSGNGILYNILKRKLRTGSSVSSMTHQEGNDIWSTCQIFQNFNFTLDFLLLDWFQNLDNTLFVIRYIDGFEDFRIFASTQFSNELKL